MIISMVWKRKKRQLLWLRVDVFSVKPTKMESTRKKSKTVSKLTGRFNSTETIALSRIFTKITGKRLL